MTAVQEPPRRRRRRARTLLGTAGVVVLAALVPGAGLLYAGRRVLGALVLLAAGSAVGWAGWHFGRDPGRAVELAFDPDRLQGVVLLLLAGLALWAVTVAATYVLVRPRGSSRTETAVGAAFLATVLVAGATPVAVGARYAGVQAGFVADVFEDNATATAPEVTTEDPWDGQDRVNVLLLGGDAGAYRTGVRTDTVILASIDTGTGRTVLFSLPRNLMRAQFPEGSPLQALYPDGFTGDGDPAQFMLNAVYGQVPLLHPGILGRSSNEGADAVKQAVSGSLGVPVDYYVLVELTGFRELVDAVGGVTVNVNEPVAIGGDTDAGIPPDGYLQPGPDQRLDGFQAMWFARGRYGSDDYERMDRQRCVVDALVDAADPLTLFRRFQQLAATGRRIVRTDIPLRLMPAFVDLAMRVKDRRIRSVVFDSSDDFVPGDPDYDYLRERVATVLAASGQPGGGRAVRRATDDVEDACAYQPAEEVVP